MMDDRMDLREVSRKLEREDLVASTISTYNCITNLMPMPALSITHFIGVPLLLAIVMTSSISGASDRSVPAALRIKYARLVAQKAVPIAAVILLAIFLTISGISSLRENAATPQGAVTSMVVLSILLAVIYVCCTAYIYIKSARLVQKESSRQRDIERDASESRATHRVTGYERNTTTPLEIAEARDVVPENLSQTNQAQAPEYEQRQQQEQGRISQPVPSKTREYHMMHNILLENEPDRLITQHETPSGVPANVMPGVEPTSHNSQARRLGPAMNPRVRIDPRESTVNQLAPAERASMHVASRENRYSYRASSMLQPSLQQNRLNTRHVPSPVGRRSLSKDSGKTPLAGRYPITPEGDPAPIHVPVSPPHPERFDNLDDSNRRH
ncbi:hypothetical protein GQ53DRAFT_229650 [Thozetella sp. PMI_491]|nr:hypothetical protein GQ53DRAFT_229650 [Thozetella sp. PMI_491]